MNRIDGSIVFGDRWMKIKNIKQKIAAPYRLMLMIYAGFIAVALTQGSGSELLTGFLTIIGSRSILITDYIAVGGIGATLLNVVLVGSISIGILIKADVKPDGAVIMALWMTTGFSFFGKNIFNMLPIMIGVWGYVKMKKEPFRNYAVTALLSATISPIVSEIGFLSDKNRVLCIACGIVVGFVAGFLFPALVSFCAGLHRGYCLYNIGFAGGLMSSCICAVMQSFQIEVESVLIWSTGNNKILAVILYSIAGILIGTGIVRVDQKRFRCSLEGLIKLKTSTVKDFYALIGRSVYINMGVLCILGTTVVLMAGGDLNGATISGIFTMTGFAAYGKHIRNVIPAMAGAILCTCINVWDMTAPANILTILFSSGHALIAGQYGRRWGFIAGFLHVTFVGNIRYLNSGMNLYNNGFAAGFIVLILLPVISVFQDVVSKKKLHYEVK